MRSVPERRINEILGSIERIERYTDTLTYEDFLADELMIGAVTFNLAIIGEAAGHISQNARAIYREIDWQSVMRLRDLFFPWNPGADHKVKWDVIKTELPALQSELTD